MKDKRVYRISGIGYCPRKLSAIMLGQQPDTERPKWLEQSAEEGKWHEARIKKELQSQGMTISSTAICDICARAIHEERNGTHLEREYPEFILQGHLDGIIVHDKHNTYFKDGSSKVLEIKSMSQYEFDRWMKGRWEAFPQYADQLTAYMYIYNESVGEGAIGEALYVVKNRNNGYKDIFVQRGFPSDYNAILARIMAVEAYVKQNELHPAEYNPLNIECKRCEYKGSCLPASKEEFTRIEEAEILGAGQLWREGKAMAKLAEEKITTAEAILKGHAEANSQNRTAKYKYMTNGLVVNGYPTKETSISYVKKAGWECRITDTKKEED
jgi:hypothetical protein